MRPAPSDRDELESLVDRIADGDDEAFEILFRRLSPQVLGFARARGCLDAEGLVNDVFVTVYRKISTFSGNGIEFRAWLFRIARNKMIDQGRAAGRRVDETALETASPNDRHLRVVDDPQLDDPLQPLLQHLEPLTEQQRDVVLLRVIGELSIAETGDLLGLSVASVKSTFHRATRILESTLRETNASARPSADTDRSSN